MSPHQIRRALNNRLGYLETKLQRCSEGARGYLEAEYRALQIVLERQGLLDNAQVDRTVARVRERDQRPIVIRENGAVSLADALVRELRVT